MPISTPVMMDIRTAEDSNVRSPLYFMSDVIPIKMKEIIKLKKYTTRRLEYFTYFLECIFGFNCWYRIFDR